MAVPPGYEEGPDRVTGGPSRSASVRNALAAAPEATVAVVHDAARPLVTAELVERCLPLSRAWTARSPPRRSPTRSIRWIRRAGDRFHPAALRLWAAQTPQVFRADILRRALATDDATLAAATDDAALVVAAGGRARVVESPTGNVKVTTENDLRDGRGAPVLTDYHVHLRPDETTLPRERYFTADNVERYREAAAERGIDELGVAEHIHRFVQALEVWTHPWYRHWAADDLDEYCGFVQSPAAARNRGGLPPGPRGPPRHASRRAAVDYVVGSVHFIARRGRGRPRRARLGVLGRLALERPREGLGALLRDARRGSAHRDVRHPGPSGSGQGLGCRGAGPDGDLRRFYERAMDGIAESDVAVEVSTAGLRKPVAEIYPSRPSWRCAWRPGGRWRCRATRTRPSSSATNTSGRCSGSTGWA